MTQHYILYRGNVPQERLPIIHNDILTSTESYTESGSPIEASFSAVGSASNSAQEVHYAVHVKRKMRPRSAGYNTQTSVSTSYDNNNLAHDDDIIVADYDKIARQ